MSLKTGYSPFSLWSRLRCHNNFSELLRGLFWGRYDFIYHSKFRRLWQKIMSIFPRYISINHIRIVRTIFFFENYWNRWENQASRKMLHTHPVKTEDMFLHDSNALLCRRYRLHRRKNTSYLIVKVQGSVSIEKFPLLIDGFVSSYSHTCKDGK